MKLKLAKASKSLNIVTTNFCAHDRNDIVFSRQKDPRGMPEAGRDKQMLWPGVGLEWLQLHWAGGGRHLQKHAQGEPTNKGNLASGPITISALVCVLSEYIYLYVVHTVALLLYHHLYIQYLYYGIYNIVYIYI